MKRSLAVGVLAMSTLAAWAADDGGRGYFVPKIGYTFADNDRLVDDDLHYGFAVGKHLNERWALELNGLWSAHDGKGANSGSSLEITTISADVLRVFRNDSNFSPYLTAGAGYLSNNVKPIGSTDDFMAQAGGGLLMRAWENADGSRALNIRPEAKLRWDDAHSAGYLMDILVSVGFEFTFGAPTVHPAAVAPPPPPPPPPPAAVVAPQPVDSDGDGVLDVSDRCPGTPRGTVVDSTGCPRRGSVTLAGVQFENNSAKLKSESFAALASVAADLKEHPRLKVEIQGHTDSVGADAYNQTLSQSRADSVRDYLISQGVSASQLTAKGYGESKPVADNKTAEGRAENRRVVMDVIDNPGDVEVKKVD